VCSVTYRLGNRSTDRHTSCNFALKEPMESGVFKKSDYELRVGRICPNLRSASLTNVSQVSNPVKPCGYFMLTRACLNIIPVNFFFRGLKLCLLLRSESGRKQFCELMSVNHSLSDFLLNATWKATTCLSAASLSNVSILTYVL
jgi:hypothetical protein